MRGTVEAERPFTELRDPALPHHIPTNKGPTYMHKAILGAASILTLASPAVAADLPVTPYSEVPSYEYRTAPPVIVEEPAPVVAVPPPPVVVYPIYAPPRVYAAPPVYAYARPVWRGGWGHPGHFRGRW